MVHVFAVPLPDSGTGYRVHVHEFAVVATLYLIVEQGTGYRVHVHEFAVVATLYLIIEQKVQNGA